MSVPRRSVLSCSRGFLASLNANINSPQQNQNVNVVVNPLDRVSVKYPDINNNEAENNDVKERSVETAEETLINLQNIIHDKDLLIQALILCLDIIENNPLIVNKYIIADEDALIKLIKLLTDTSEVELLKADPDSYCCKSNTYDYVSKIYVHKDNETFNLKYSFPDVCEFLTQRKISMRFVKSTGITYK